MEKFTWHTMHNIKIPHKKNAYLSSVSSPVGHGKKEERNSANNEDNVTSTF